MATKRSTFQKRQRETDLKDKARAKEARRAAKRERARNGITTPDAADVTGEQPPTGEPGAVTTPADPNTDPRPLPEAVAASSMK